MRIDGINQVKASLAAAAARAAKGFERGLVKAGLTLQRESQLLVPVDTGNLKNSASTRKEGSGFETVVSVAYSASYSLFVHENLEAHHPVGQAKFLEQPAREYADELARIVSEEVKKGA